MKGFFSGGIGSAGGGNAGGRIRVNGLGQYKRPAALLLSGILLLAGASVYEKRTESGKMSRPQNETAAEDGSGSENGAGGDYAAYARYEEQRLAAILSEIEGVGTVKVAVYVTSTPAFVPITEEDTESARTEERDSEGGTRVTESHAEKKDTVPDASGGAAESYVSFPEIKGVLIFAKGASGASVREKITKAVAALYGIPIHCIAVLPQ